MGADSFFPHSVLGPRAYVSSQNSTEFRGVTLALRWRSQNV